MHQEVPVAAVVVVLAWRLLDCVANRFERPAPDYVVRTRDTFAASVSTVFHDSCRA